MAMIWTQISSYLYHAAMIGADTKSVRKTNHRKNEELSLIVPILARG